MHPNNPWTGTPTLNIAIHADDRAGVIHSINLAITQCRSTLRCIRARADDEQATIQLLVEVELSEGNTLADLMLALKYIPGIRNVEPIPHA